MSARAPASPYAGEGGRTVRVLDAAGAREIAGPWRALAAAAMEPNIFYDPDFLLPAAEAFAAPGRLRFLVIGSGDRLLFLLPFRIVGTGPLTVAEAFRHPYATTTAPLLAAEDAGPALRLWLGGGAAALNACAWRLGEMPAGGPLHRALGQAAREVGAAIGTVSTHERAMLAPPEPVRDYLGLVLSRKARKELSRQARRLAGDEGLRHRVLEAEDAVAGFEDFLALEAAGWKGRAGTAMILDDAAATFGRRAARELSARGKLRIDQLLADGRVVAATITLLGGGASWLWKVAYDEAYAKYSPAVQLIAGMTQELAANRPGVRMDSCAVPDHPMIDRLWRERLPIADMLIGVPGRRAGFAAALALARAEKAGRDMARRLLRR